MLATISKCQEKDETTAFPLVKKIRDRVKKRGFCTVCHLEYIYIVRGSAGIRSTDSGSSDSGSSDRGSSVDLLT